MARPTGFHLVAAALALALVNHLAGRLGLLLAIPPGFATAVFPPSGIALGALLLWGNRVWPGVWLGSFSFNVQLALASSPDATLLAVTPVALSIAIGSTLQAVLAASFIRKHTREPTELVRERDVVTLLCIGGPILCLVASSWGVATLVAAGVMANGIGLAWFTWWVGDTIGVLIFTPLVLAVCARPRAIWRPRLLSVGTPLCIAFGLVVAVYIVVGEREKESIAANFRRRIETLDRALTRDMQAHAEVLWSIRSFFAGSQVVDADEFRVFVQRSLAAHPGLRALSWNPCVRDKDRAAFESEMREQLDGSFEIRARDANGALVRAPEADEHVAVQYIEPRAQNTAALGFDVFADPERRRAVERARDTGDPVASSRIDLVQESGAGLLLFLPVYETDATPPTQQLRRSAFRGVVAAVVQVDALTTGALAGLSTEGILLRLWDDSSPADSTYLGSYPQGAGRTKSGPNAAEYEVVIAHDVGTRSWTLRFAPTAAYLATQPHWQAWMVLAGGLSLTGLLGAFLLVMTGRSALEASRLNEVADVNERLRLTNEELARFASAASHDLRAPLRGVSHLAGFLIEDHGDSLAPEALEHLIAIRSRVHRMSRLLEDLLQYSRIGWLEEEAGVVHTADLVREIVALSPERDGFTIESHGMTEMLTHRVPLAQALRNLVANSIKHHDRGSGHIDVTCSDLGDRYEFAVRDDGPGIPPEHHAQVFEMFKSLRPRDEVEGSGMGLAFVRKIVGNRGGVVAVDSDGKRGTTIRFTWPKITRNVARNRAPVNLVPQLTP